MTEGFNSHGKSECFHCGLSMRSSPFECTASLGGHLRFFCCPACRAVAESINFSGLSQFYDYREGNRPSTLPSAQSQDDYSAYDDENTQNDFVKVVDAEAGLYEASLYISNISCAACAWLIEHYLEGRPGIRSVSVHVSTRHCQIVWDKSNHSLSEILNNLHAIGYQALPATEDSRTESRLLENKSALLRLGVAGIGMMQVGMVAIALHAGDIQGIDDQWKGYLRWVNLIFALPVMTFSAQPFFVSALRVLKLGSVNMDVSVSLALLLAFSASVWATLFNTADVYFDSLCMLVFFLLLGRYLEMRVRHKSEEKGDTYSRLLPYSVDYYADGVIQKKPLKSLCVNDLLQVSAGTVFPCDGVVVDGRSHANESMLTGEFVPVEKTEGSPVLAGSTNGPSALLIKVSALGCDTVLNRIRDIRDAAQHQKPKFQSLIAKVSVWFVTAVLSIALINFSVWLYIQPSSAFWVTLSILVVTCPCALSLAAPAALTAGVHRLQKNGLLITSADFLERVTKTTHLVFDKTGTLTSGVLTISKVHVIDGQKSYTEQQVLELIAALESKSAHPIASAFDSISFGTPAKNVSVVQAKGVEGDVAGVHYRFGKSDFASFGDAMLYPGEGAWQLLSSNEQAIAWVLLADELKPNALSVISELKALNIDVSIASGDRAVNVESLCEVLGIEAFVAGASPQDKLDYIKRLQDRGASVLMVGDGINDVPIMSAADTSIAMGSATQLTKSSAGSILLNGDLGKIPQGLVIAHRVQKKIRQNLLWALLYNVLALPLAVLGFIPPYVAAIGMSLSSLIVVVNSLSLNASEPKLSSVQIK